MLLCDDSGRLPSRASRAKLAQTRVNRRRRGNMPKAFFFDIDGTLANGLHRVHHLKKSPKDWDAYFATLSEDSVIAPVAEVCRALHSAGGMIVYITGRPGEHINATFEWLKVNNLPHGPIYHRESGDYRDDNIVKIELLKEAEKDGLEPIVIFDDRKRVVLAVRGAGYTVAQVADGDY